MAFGRGAAGAEQAQKENRPRRDRTEYFKIEEDGGEAIIRLVHDGDAWYYVKQHGFVPTKDRDPDWDEDRKYPTRMGAVCRRDKAFEYGECYICDELHKRVPNEKTKAKGGGKYYPNIRYFVPAVLRQEVRGTQEMIDAGDIPATVKVRGADVSTIGKVVTYEDITEDHQPVDDEGNPVGPVVQRPKVVIINMAHDNFFAHLQGFYETPNDDEELTVLDRDFRVKREGKGTDTKYRIRPLKPVKGHDLRDPATLAIYDFVDVEKFMSHMASDEFYDYYFDDRHERPVRDDEKGDEESGEEEKPKRKPSARKAATPSAKAQEKPAETDEGDDADDEPAAPAAAKPASGRASLADVKARMTKSHAAKAPAKTDPEPEAAADDGDEETSSATESAEEEDSEDLVGAV